MTSSQIRQSYLDFFRSKQHTIVPSSSLMPDSPNLLFTNAGMNQFVPIFLGQQPCPYQPGRAADTQKCIRAGGKHNDLEDVGLDTYHHTFFEMLGNWSFGDYFKKDAIDWAWELLTQVWKFPPARLFATVYSPDKAKGDPAEFDQEAYDHWARIFTAAGLDPAVHIVNGNKKDNFWMMGETGPCGPCSEIHVDLTPGGDTRGSLVNKGSAECIEIWNLVFIQFNANADGSFVPLPAQHVDTGMGFERVTGIMQCTKGFIDFSRPVSNYETDVFRPIFDALERLSGKRYASTLPAAGTTGANEQEKIDVAFRVIADHIRTLSFAIADGIQPGNTDRHYVLRRILRRAVRYGRALGFREPFFYKLVDVLAETMGDVFPEIRARKSAVQDTLRIEEEAFDRTLDFGIESLGLYIKGAKRASEVLLKLETTKTPNLLEEIEKLKVLFYHDSWTKLIFAKSLSKSPSEVDLLNDDSELLANRVVAVIASGNKTQLSSVRSLLLNISGDFAFKLYDTYGFPVDLTDLMAREQGLSVDHAGFEVEMEKQRARARAAQKKTVIEVSQLASDVATAFVGFEQLETAAKVAEVLDIKGRTAVVLDRSSCYAEMGGQVGDTGQIRLGGQLWRVVDTQKAGAAWLHFVDGADAPEKGAEVVLAVDAARRAAIQRHHTVTHLLHWALHEVVRREASQKGSSVGPDKLTFDFNSAAVTPAQLADIERLVNERIVENASVSWREVPYADVKARKDVMQFFGDKYGDTVRVVQIGGAAGALDGYSMELCGGTHTRATGEIGLFRITGEGAIAAGIRRIEAVAGLAGWQSVVEDIQRLKQVAATLNCAPTELDKRIESLLAHQKELEKQLKAVQLKQAGERAAALLSQAITRGGRQTIVTNLGDADGDTVAAVAEHLKARFNGVIVLGGAAGGSVTLLASVAPEFTKQVQAGKLIQAIAPIVGGKGGGKPEFARGGGKDASKVDEALAAAVKLLEGN
ncbi:MAG TPA: alanine--tRNA ligase [Kiritimatiellia bacterium]|nr:alanine--tRNA ligase [Kiritimatiellia bacterium]